MRPDTYTIHPRRHRRSKTARAWWRRHCDDILVGGVCMWYIAFFVLCLRIACTGGNAFSALFMMVLPPCIYGVALLIVAQRGR